MDRSNRASTLVETAVPEVFVHSPYVHSILHRLQGIKSKHTERVKQHAHIARSHRAKMLRMYPTRFGISGFDGFMKAGSKGVAPNLEV